MNIDAAQPWNREKWPLKHLWRSDTHQHIDIKGSQAFQKLRRVDARGINERDARRLSKCANSAASDLHKDPTHQQAKKVDGSIEPPNALCSAQDGLVKSS